MIAIIRISGLIKTKGNIEETLNRMKLRKKYACVIADENKSEILGMVKKVRNFIAYGKIEEKTLSSMIKERGRKIGNRKARISEADSVKLAKEIINGKKMEELGLKPFFGLHPARGGINTKLHYPKGVLGYHGDNINKLIMRML